MSNFNIGIGLALDGEKEFRTGIKEVNSELRLLASQSKLVEAQYASNANSLEALTAKHDLLVKQLEAEEKKVKLNSTQLEAWQGVSQRAEERVNELKQKLADAQEEMDKMKTSSGATSEELEKQQKTIDNLSNQLESAERAYNESEEKVTKYQTSLNKVETDLTKLNTELQENENSLKDAKQASDVLTSAVYDYGDEVDDAKTKTSTFGDVLKANLISEAIIQGVKKLATEIAEIASSAVSTGASFEKSMSQVAATMGLTAEEIENGSEAYETLKNAAEDSGKSTKYTASQAAEALNYLALAGYDAQKAAATLPAVLNVASAGGLDLAYASDLVTDSMGALGMETSELNKYIDEMAKTSQKSNTSVAQLGEATLVAAGMVSLTGQSLETMNTELGVLANNGIKGSEGGTHLRNILQRLVAPTEAGAEALKILNVAVTDSQGSVRDLNDIMVDMNNSLSDLSEASKTGFITTIFKQTDIAAVNALLKGTGDEFNNLYNELLDCEGAAGNMASTMEANLTGKVTILQSALEGLAITAYDKIKGTLSSSVDEATKSVGRLQDSMDNGKLGKSMDELAETLDDAAAGAINFAEDALPAVIDGLTWLLDNTDIVAAGVAGITTAGIGMKVVTPAVEAVTAAWQTYKNANEGATVAQWLLNTAMDANPAGILITAIAALTAAIVAYELVAEDEMDTFREELEILEENRQKLKENAQERQNCKNDMLLQAETAKKLAAEIETLNKKEELSESEQQELKTAVAELNAIYPDLNLSINENTGHVEGNTQALQANVDALIAQAEAVLYQEQMAEVAEEAAEAQIQLTKIEKEQKEVAEQLAGYQEELNKKLEDAGEDAYAASYAWEQYYAAANDLITQDAMLTEEMETQSAVIEDLKTQMSDLSEAEATVTESAEEAKAAIEETDKVSITYKDNTYEVSAEVATNIGLIEEAYAEAYAEAYDSINSQVGLFQELSAESELTATQMAENLKTQTDVFTQYSNNLILASELMKEDTEGNFTEMVTAIEEMGIDGAGYLDELITAYQEGSDSFDEVLNEWASMADAKQTLVETMADFEKNYTESMDSLLGIQTERTLSMQKDINDKMTDTLGTVKLKDAEAVTEITNTMETLNTTVEKEGETVKETTIKVVSDTLEEVRKELGISNDKSTVFEEIGMAMCTGWETGILKGKDKVTDAAKEVAEASYKAAKSTLQINSQSRQFEWLGEKSSEGVAQGYIKNMESVGKKIGAATEEMLNFVNISSITKESASIGTIPITGESVNSELNENMKKVAEMFEEYMPLLLASAQKQIILNSGVLVGELAPDIDRNLGGIANWKERSNR